MNAITLAGKDLPEKYIALRVSTGGAERIAPISRVALRKLENLTNKEAKTKHSEICAALARAGRLHVAGLSESGFSVASISRKQNDRGETQTVTYFKPAENTIKQKADAAATRVTTTLNKNIEVMNEDQVNAAMKLLMENIAKREAAKSAASAAASAPAPQAPVETPAQPINA